MLQKQYVVNTCLVLVPSTRVTTSPLLKPPECASDVAAAIATAWQPRALRGRLGSVHYTPTSRYPGYGGILVLSFMHLACVAGNL